MSRAIPEMKKHRLAAFAEAIVFADEPEIVETIWLAFLEGSTMECIGQNSDLDSPEVINGRNAARRYLAAIMERQVSGRDPVQAVFQTPDFDAFLEEVQAMREKMKSGAERQEQLYERLAKQDLAFEITNDGARGDRD
jgi:hypothetical protein